MKYRLGNQVEIVSGKHAAALYDHYRGLVQRIPLAAAPLLGPTAIGELSQNEIASSFFQGLLSRGYVEPIRDYAGEPFRADWTLPRFPPLRTLSFELDAGADAAAIDLLIDLATQAVSEFGVLSVVIVVDRAPATLFGLVERLLALDPQLMVELLCTADAWQAIAASPTASPRLMRIEAAPKAVVPAYDMGDARRAASFDATPVSPELFIGNFDYFHLLSRHGESQGCLHVDAGMRVFPDICERSYEVADLRRQSRTLAELVRDERTQRYWSAGKDGREKCRDCEFRYACPNPVAHRSDAADLASAPRNCGYDLETGTWEKAA